MALDKVMWMLVLTTVGIFYLSTQMAMGDARIQYTMLSSAAQEAAWSAQAPSVAVNTASTAQAPAGYFAPAAISAATAAQGAQAAQSAFTADVQGTQVSGPSETESNSGGAAIVSAAGTANVPWYSRVSGSFFDGMYASSMQIPMQVTAQGGAAP